MRQRLAGMRPPGRLVWIATRHLALLMVVTVIALVPLGPDATQAAGGAAEAHHEALCGWAY